MQLTAVLIPAEEGGFVALNPETGTTSQGESIEEALANLQEATELYLEEFPVVSFGKPFLTTFEVPAHAAWPSPGSREMRRSGHWRSWGSYVSARKVAT